MDRKDPQELSKVRLKEATALLKLGLFDGAYYLAGYSVECALKACIAKATQRGEFLDRKRVVYSHKLRDLIKVAGLEGARLKLADRDPFFQANCLVVLSWTEESRYQRHPPESARELLGAIANRQHGVMSWIKLQW